MNAYATRYRRLVRTTAAIGLVIAALLLTSCGLVATEQSAEDSDAWTTAYPGAPETPAYEEELYGRGDVKDEMAPIEPPVGGSGVDASTVPPDERYVIRSVGLRIRVDEVEDAVERVRAEVDKADGIVTGAQVSTDEDIPIYRYEATGPLADGTPLKGFVTARIPAENLPGFLDAVSGLGTVLRQAEDESDVTQEHIDLTARLDNLTAQEERLREFFDKAEKVEEMLAIEAELGRVRGEIESLTAQRAYLERQAAMATVTVELAGTPPVVSPVGSDWGFVRAITQGIRGFVSTVNAAIVVFMSALPLIIIAVVVWLVVRWALRRRRSHGAVDPAHGDTAESGTPEL